MLSCDRTCRPRVPYMTATSIPSMSIAVRVEAASKPCACATSKCGCRARLRRRNSRLEAIAPGEQHAAHFAQHRQQVVDVELIGRLKADRAAAWAAALAKRPVDG